MKDQRAVTFTVLYLVAELKSAINYEAKPYMLIFLHFLMYTDLVRVDVHSFAIVGK